MGWLGWLDDFDAWAREWRWQRLQAEWNALGPPPSPPPPVSQPPPVNAPSPVSTGPRQVSTPGGPSTGGGGGGGINTPSEFARVVLDRLGLPATQRNVENVVRWYNKEGGHWRNSAQHNPLNTTLNSAGVVDVINSHGVKAYDSWEHGINAVVETLRHPRYTQILSVLRRQGSCSELSQAVGSSRWGTGTFACGGSLPGDAGPGLGAGVPSVDESGCAWRLGIGPLSGCVISRSQARVLKGGAVLVAGSALMLAGTAILAQNIVTTAAAGSVLEAASAAGKMPGRARRAVQGRRDERRYQASESELAEEGRRARTERAREAFREGRRSRTRESGANRPNRGTRAANRRRRERVGVAGDDETF